LLDSARRAPRAADDALNVGTDPHETTARAGQAGLRVHRQGVHRSATADYARTWYRERTAGQLPETVNVSMLGWGPDGVGTELEELAPYALSTAHTPEACWEWAIPPWLRIPADTADAPALRDDLGARDPGAPRQLAAPFLGQGCLRGRR
jgi:hypothetical protein